MKEIATAEITVEPSTFQSVLYLRVRAPGGLWDIVRFTTEALADLASQPELSDRERFDQLLREDSDPLLERVIKTSKIVGMDWNQPTTPLGFSSFAH